MVREVPAGSSPTPVCIRKAARRVHPLRAYSISIGCISGGPTGPARMNRSVRSAGGSRHWSSGTLDNGTREHAGPRSGQRRADDVIGKRQGPRVKTFRHREFIQCGVAVVWARRSSSNLLCRQALRWKATRSTGFRRSPTARPREELRSISTPTNRRSAGMASACGSGGLATDAQHSTDAVRGPRGQIGIPIVSSFRPNWPAGGCAIRRPVEVGGHKFSSPG
jgi:hypothetical protein